MKIEILKASDWNSAVLLKDEKLKPLDLYYERCSCFTEKFATLGEAVEFMTKNIYPKVIVETEDEHPAITIYDYYVE